MSSIGSGPGAVSGATIDVAAVLQVGSTDTRLTSSTDASVTTPQVATGTTGSQSDTTSAAGGLSGALSARAVVTSTATSAGSSPVDSDRVAAIKKAIETGNYPIVPTKIGDAMIAASMLLRTPK